MIRVMLLSFLFLLFGLDASAQQPSLDFGDISEEEWAMKRCDFDTLANAVLLLAQGTVDFGDFNANLRYHRRIKLLNESSYEEASIQIEYYRKDNRERIINLKAFTFLRQADGHVNKIEVTDFYDEDLNENWSWKKFTFPALAPGAIIEYSYTLVTDRIRTLKPWNFMGELPVVYSEFKLSPSGRFQYNIIGTGTHFSKKYNGSNKMNKWSLEKLPGYANEKFVICPYDYIDRIRFQLRSAVVKGEKINLIDNWKALNHKTLEIYAGFLKKGNDRKLIKTLISDEDDAFMKAKKIFAYMKRTFVWNGYEGIYPNGKVRAFLKSKQGNVADLNLYMLGLLKAAKLEVYPLLLSTKKHGKPIMNFPLLGQFNRVICHLKIGDEVVFMDLGSDNEYLPYNKIPYQDLNYFGFLLKKKEPEWVEIPVSTDNSIAKIITLNLNTLEGSYKGRFTGYLAADVRKKYEAEASLLNAKYVEGVDGQEVIVLEEQLTVKNKEAIEKPVVIEIPLELGTFEQDDFLYFTPKGWTEYGQNPFDEEKRVLPIEFYCGKSMQYVIKVTPPEAYRIGELPDELALKLPAELGDFIYSVRQDENQGVVINFSFRQEAVYMSPVAYPYLKEIYAQMSEKLGEAIVFKKK